MMGWLSNLFGTSGGGDETDADLLRTGDDERYAARERQRADDAKDNATRRDQQNRGTHSGDWE